MNLELSQSQKQILSGRMQLSVQILQMNALELEQYIQEAALENPLIDLEMPQEPEDIAVIRAEKPEWLDYADVSTYNNYVNRQTDEEDSAPLYDKDTSESLAEALLEQVLGMALPAETARVVRRIIADLDDNGYLSSSREQLIAESGASVPVFEEALKVVQNTEPPGVGAADLRECLLIQARRLENRSPVLIPLIESKLELLAKNLLSKLAGELGVSIEEVKTAREQLLTLNPKPGNGFSSHRDIPYIRPDVFILRYENRFQAFFNDYRQPKIEISNYYRTMAKDSSPEVSEYLDDRLRKAQWLISCVNQRKKTLQNCVSSILVRQQRFFEQGPGNLTPMILAQVAEDLNMHPSTISRAVQGKYLQCQWGVFALSEFFSRSIEQTEGEALSQDMIKQQLLSIVSQEDRAHPFSDQELVAELLKHNIQIARRTVAKYREQLGLASASGRKLY